MLDLTFVAESLKRRWWIAVVVAVVFGAAGLVSMVTAKGETLLPTYTAEAVVYVDARQSSDVNDYNYVINDEFVAGDAHRFVLNNSVAGEVRRTYGEDVIISSPLWQNELTKLEAKTHFVFVDATAGDEATALDAANMAAELAASKIEQEVEGAKANVSDKAALKTTSANVADFGVDDLTLSPMSQAGSSLSVKKLVVFFGVGLIVGVALVLIVEYCRRRVRSAHDVERLLGVRVLDEVEESDASDGANYRRCAGIIDAIVQREGCDAPILCGWRESQVPENVVSHLNDAMRKSRIVGWAGLSSHSCDTSALVDADSAIVVVVQNEQSAKELDEMVRCIGALGMKVLGAIYVQAKRG